MQHFNSFPGNKQHKFQPSPHPQLISVGQSLIFPNLQPASPSYTQPGGFFHEITLLSFFHEITLLNFFH